MIFFYQLSPKYVSFISLFWRWHKSSENWVTSQIWLGSLYWLYPDSSLVYWLEADQCQVQPLLFFMAKLSTQCHCCFLSAALGSKVFGLPFWTRPQLVKTSAWTVTTPCLWIRGIQDVSSVIILLGVCTALCMNTYLNLGLKCSAWKYSTCSAGTLGIFTIWLKFYRLLKIHLQRKQVSGMGLPVHAPKHFIENNLKKHAPKQHLSQGHWCLWIKIFKE